MLATSAAPAGQPGCKHVRARAYACELAGAATTAALLARKIGLEPGQTTAAVVSGGNVATETAVAILAGQ